VIDRISRHCETSTKKIDVVDNTTRDLS